MIQLLIVCEEESEDLIYDVSIKFILFQDFQLYYREKPPRLLYAGIENLEKKLLALALGVKCLLNEPFVLHPKVTIEEVH
jgi:hypothetical protein